MHIGTRWISCSHDFSPFREACVTLIGRPTSGPCTLLLTESCSMVRTISVNTFISHTDVLVAPKLGLPVKQSAVNSVTRGLIGDSSFAVLPNILPRTTFALTLSFQIVGALSQAAMILRCLYLVVMSDQAFPPTNMGHVHWRSDPLWVRVFLVRLACP